MGREGALRWRHPVVCPLRRHNRAKARVAKSFFQVLARGKQGGSPRNPVYQSNRPAYRRGRNRRQEVAFGPGDGGLEVPKVLFDVRALCRKRINQSASEILLALTRADFQCGIDKVVVNIWQWEIGRASCR